MNSSNLNSGCSPLEWDLLENCHTLVDKGEIQRAIRCFRRAADRVGHAATIFNDVLSIGQLQNVSHHLREQADEILRGAQNFTTYIPIGEGVTGFGYKQIFGHFLDDPLITEVAIQEPYIEDLTLIIRFCELLVINCKNLRGISFITRQESAGSNSYQLNALRNSLNQRNINFDYRFNKVDERFVRFDNGLIIEIGLGLNYFQPLKSELSLGLFNLAFRHCRQTKIKISYNS